MDVALITLLHVLVLVYWLGGDLGAFLSSFVLSDAKAAPAARMTAAKLLANLDMAPRTALILAAPTGITLAQAKGWLTLAPELLATIWIAGLIWLALAWRQHLLHTGPKSLTSRADLVIRAAAIAALIGAAALAPMPLFLQIKCALLAMAIVAGLLIRLMLRPFGPALGQLATGAPTPETNAVIAQSLNRARPAVLAIWAILVAAAWLGLAAPQ